MSERDSSVEGETQRVPAIGIDLGSTYCRVAVWRDGIVTVIANKLGNKRTPSYVAFTGKNLLIGEAAKEQVLVNQENSIRAVKRLLGVSYTDEKVQEELKLRSFNAEGYGASDHQIRLKVVFNDEERLLAPEELVAMLLMKMKEIAEVHLELEGTRKVKDAVITVPSYFNQFQRQATLNAAAIAGLNVLRLINETTAAALAYELNKDYVDVETTKKIMFYCFGGGSLSVNIVEIENGSKFQVISTSGDSHLGGEDFDNKLVKYFLERYQRKFNEEIHGDPRAVLRLKDACEEAKKNLSSYTEAMINLDHIHNDRNFIAQITRNRFENLCADLFRSAIEPVEKCLEAAKMDKSEISDIVLVGGTTKIPKIRELIKNFFNREELSKPPRKAVVYGAAVQAAVLSEATNPAVPKVDISDVTPFSFKYTICTGDCSINERNSKVPFVHALDIGDTSANQNPTVVRFPVLSEETRLGYVRLTFAATPEGVESLASCTFRIDDNGIFNVFQHLDGDTEDVLRRKAGRQLTPAEILRMTSDAAKFKEEDEKERKLASDRNELEVHMIKVSETLEQASKKAKGTYLQVMTLLDDEQLADQDCVAATYTKIKNDLHPLVKESDEMLCRPYPAPAIHPEDHPAS